MMEQTKAGIEQLIIEALADRDPLATMAATEELGEWISRDLRAHLADLRAIACVEAVRASDAQTVSTLAGVSVSKIQALATRGRAAMIAAV